MDDEFAVYHGEMTPTAEVTVSEEGQTTKRSIMDLKVSTWLAIIGTIFMIGGAGAGLASKFFATKTELKDSEKDANDKIVKVSQEADTRLQNYRIQKVEVHVDNLDSRQQRIDKNVEKLLERWHVQPAPMPIMKPMPTLPAPLIEPEHTADPP